MTFATEFHGKANPNGLRRFDNGVGDRIPGCYQLGRDYALLPPIYMLDGVEYEAPAAAPNVFDFSQPGHKSVADSVRVDQLFFVHRHGPSRRYSTPRKSERARESDRFLHEGSRLGYPTIKGSNRVQVLLLVGLGLVAAGLLMTQSMAVPA